MRSAKFFYYIDSTIAAAIVYNNDLARVRLPPEVLDDNSQCLRKAPLLVVRGDDDRKEWAQIRGADGTIPSSESSIADLSRV